MQSEVSLPSCNLNRSAPLERREHSFNAAFVLPITRDGRVLLTKEQRGSEVKFGMLGGKSHEAETDFETMSREANEETGGALSEHTLKRITRGAGILDGARVYYERSKSVAVKHDLVVPGDLDKTKHIPRSCNAVIVSARGSPSPLSRLGAPDHR